MKKFVRQSLTHAYSTRAYIVGVGQKKPGKYYQGVHQLIQEAFHDSLRDAVNSSANKYSQFPVFQLDGVITHATLERNLMLAHYLAGNLGLRNDKILAKTIDCGGASPVSCLIEAAELIKRGKLNAIAVLGGDVVGSLDSNEFMSLSAGVSRNWVKREHGPQRQETKLPPIYALYDAVAQWSIFYMGTTREQLAMVPILMSRQGVHHPDSMISQRGQQPYTLKDILDSKNVAPVTNILECARRCDGAVSLIVVSEEIVRKLNLQDRAIPILGGGEASTSLSDSTHDYQHEWSNSYFSAERASSCAYAEANLTVKDIGYFGLYDCYPICFIEALEGVGLCKNGEGGRLVEEFYNNYKEYNPGKFPFNTHGGLLSHGAPWESPSFYSIAECVNQLRGEAQNRQVFPKPKYGLCYANGGVFSASAVSILGDPQSIHK
jgi:acetyl-CoA acetyltransferase